MFSHIALGMQDVEATKAFYDAVLGALGVPPGQLDALGRLVYMHEGGRLVLVKPLNGNPPTPANGGTLGFDAPSSESIDAWHVAGVTHGGVTCEDPPGWREHPTFGAIYLGYLRDPIGNKLCARHLPKAK